MSLYELFSKFLSLRLVISNWLNFLNSNQKLGVNLKCSNESNRIKCEFFTVDRTLNIRTFYLFFCFIVRNSIRFDRTEPQTEQNKSFF